MKEFKQNYLRAYLNGNEKVTIVSGHDDEIEALKLEYITISPNDIPLLIMALNSIHEEFKVS